MDTIASIKTRVDPVELIGKSTKLTRAGHNFRGLCPFHTEKTPSFYVFVDRGTWRCFGTCGEGGDIFSFVQKRDSVDFREALRLLAAEAGVELSPESSQRRSRTEHLSRVASAAVDYYQRALQAPDGEEARSYLSEKRGLSQDTIDSFHLGWAPDEWRGLRDFLNGRGYGDTDVLAAGLTIEPPQGGPPYDRFRGRVIIPIADERGQFVGFGGRGVHGEEPKYLNSPQSDLFDKGHTLYGLNAAAAAIRESGTVVVVEGYMDVLGPWQAGFRNVVATMGTSLTEHHVGLLRRYAKRIILAMDPDAAGEAAAERAGALFIALDSPQNMARSIRSASQLGSGGEIDLRVAPLPPGKDPDELTRHEPEVWRAAIDGAMPYPEYFIRRLMGDERPESGIDARRIIDRVRPTLLAVSDPIERGMYIQRVARHLGVAESAVLERIRPARQSAWRANPDPVGPADTPPEDDLLALMYRHPLLRTDLRGLPESLFSSSVNREAFRRWLAGGAESVPGEAAEDDVVAAHIERIEGRRLPPLSNEDAAKAVQRKIRELLKERAILHQLAVTETVAEAERVLGARRVSDVASEAWLSVSQPDADAQVAESVIEQMELGFSIHRREDPALS